MVTLKNQLTQFFVIVLFAVCFTVYAQSPDPTQQLLDGLHQGGYVIFIRHAATDHMQKDTNPNDYTDCAHQRNLSENGRKQAITIGEAFRALRIPVGDVYSSEFCRCMDTAKLAFGKAIATPEISSLSNLPMAEREVRVKALRRLLHRPPPAATNNIIVSHLYLFEFATGVSIEEGEAAIFRLKADGGEIELIARIQASGWHDVVARFGAK